MRSILLGALGGLVVVVGSACQASVVTGLEVRADGSGRLTAGVGLDEAALAEVGDLSAGLELDDLRRAGWSVAGPRRERDGRTWVRAARDFADPQDAAALVGELGPPFADLRLSQRRSLAKVDTALSGTVDLTGGLGAFGDPDLAALVNLDEIQQRFAARIADGVTFELSASLPGTTTVNGEVGAEEARARSDGVAVWRLTLGQKLELSARSSARRWGPLLAAVGLTLVLVAFATVVVWRRRSAPR